MAKVEDRSLAIIGVGGAETTGAFCDLVGGKWRTIIAILKVIYHSMSFGLSQCLQ